MNNYEFKFAVSSRQRLYDTFLELYPDLAKLCWGFSGFNWDSERRSILIRLTESDLEMGTRILFEVSKGPDKKWSMFRALLVPFIMTDSEGKPCAG